ncbi:MAG: 2-C-methyl-D-erythritol 4-phosphate cytidylyltransferase [Blautia sp.]|nr:2-C-methyl-D-erythritol 4-phosphate cytidylyltransferase [Lachnoclostridium sp.]MCM1210319.1 2-C-methyl-D-erythritol 4-phosphate cytidylyltransferase [Blautia sp.]
MKEKEKTAAIVLAAGWGSRMQSSVRKQYILLQDKPVLYYALKTFQDSFIDEIILVVGQGEEAYCRREIVERYHFTKVKTIVEGGRERYHSVANGLNALQGEGFVFIHDGARPFLTEDILRRVYEAVKEYHACVVGMPVKDTVKIVDDALFAMQTPNRETVWQVQTPQVFTISLAKEAYAQLMEKEQELQEKGVRITDDAMVVETLLKHPVKLVEGSYENIKITTPEDLDVAMSFFGRHS